jgi:hypothetical protein
MEEEEIAERLHQQAQAYDGDIAFRIRTSSGDPIIVEIILPGDGNNHPMPGGAPYCCLYQRLSLSRTRCVS